MDCPLDCEFLQEARKHERPAQEIDPDNFPHPEIRVTEDFLGSHEELVEAASRSLVAAAFEIPGVVDRDVRDTLDALIRTYLTLQSGVYYETRPANALANQVYGSWQESMEEFRKRETERLGMSNTRDSAVLVTLVFLQRLELDRSNGRPRGRAFLDFLRSFFGGEDSLTPRTSSLIVP